MEVQIWKNGQLVGTSDSLRRCTMIDPVHLVLADIDSLNLYYMQNVTLAAPAVFDHLAGQGLSAFLDRCGLMVSEDGKITERPEPLRYVHGRSEVAVGKSSVTSVLLVKVNSTNEVPNHEWLPLLPGIYRKFLGMSKTD